MPNNVLTPVTININAFWDATPCSMVKPTDVSEALANSMFRIRHLVNHVILHTRTLETRVATVSKLQALVQYL